MLGNGRLEAKCQDGETWLGQIRGQMRKKVCHFFERAERARRDRTGLSERSERARILVRAERAGEDSDAS